MNALYPEAWHAFTKTLTTPAHHAIQFLLGIDDYPALSHHVLHFTRAFQHMGLPRTTPNLMKPPGAVPPPLPPSVEEAYRRKCIQLKQRMNEVEEANEASRHRIVRMERSIQKMRLERAFLLEQLSKRTSTNVEDSEGSPSPPPTVRPPQLRLGYS